VFSRHFSHKQFTCCHVAKPNTISELDTPHHLNFLDKDNDEEADELEINRILIFIVNGLVFASTS